MNFLFLAVGLARDFDKPLHIAGYILSMGYILSINNVLAEWRDKLMEANPDGAVNDGIVMIVVVVVVVVVIVFVS
jgi:hypothetical protein